MNAATDTTVPRGEAGFGDVEMPMLLDFIGAVADSIMTGRPEHMANGSANALADLIFRLTEEAKAEYARIRAEAKAKA